MKSLVYIALIAIFGGIAAQGYGIKRNHKHHGRRRGPPHISIHDLYHELSHGSRKGSTSHGTHHRPTHDHRKPSHNNFRLPPTWDYSPEWEDGPNPWGSGDSSGSYGDSSDEDYDDWHYHFHTLRPCTRRTKKPGTASTRLPITVLHIHPHTLPNTQRPPWTQDITTTGFPPTRTVGPTPRPTDATGSISKSTITTWDPTTEDTIHRETTTTSLPERTTQAEEEFPTLSPEVENCIDLCPSTPEYNPVCGTDGETYDNEGKLFCASSCGVTVTLRRRSVCPPPIFDGEDGRPPPPPPLMTSPAFIGRTTPLSDFERCMRQCRITASFTPVCGTDLVTYMNMDRLKCAQNCGQVVEVLCEKPCAACGVNPVTPSTTTPAPTTVSIGITTLKPDLKECINACPVTPEYNPVCGSDHVTYKNPGHLLCAQFCGAGVSVTRLSPCSPTTTSSSTTTPFPTSLSPDILNCIRRCPVTSQYDPVCGTDDLTYTNLGDLECSSYCGLNVQFKYKSRCLDEFDLGTTSQTTEDINGQKDVVTSSWSTASTTSLFTSPTTIWTTTTPVSTLTTTVSPLPTFSLGFTIPDFILSEIFGSSTSESPPTTKPTNPDDDEDFDLDTRFGNDTRGKSRSNYGRIVYPE